MNIIVIGASQGIGYELTKQFAKNELNSIIAVSRNEKKLYDLKVECSTLSKSEISIIPFDITHENISPLINQIKKRIVSLDILINNAGLLKHKPFLDFSEKEAKQLFDTNFFAPARLIRELTPLLKKSKKAHIVNIGSMGGYQGSVKFEGLSYYSASKAAIANLTECLAQEFKTYNISVNCLALGAVQTEMLSKAFPDYEAPVTPKEMAKYITDFAINGSTFYNGKIIPLSLSTP